MTAAGGGKEEESETDGCAHHSAAHRRPAPCRIAEAGRAGVRNGPAGNSFSSASYVFLGASKFELQKLVRVELEMALQVILILPSFCASVQVPERHLVRPGQRR